MNVQDVVNRIRRTFGDDSGVQILDADILRWINDAQLQISIDNEELLEAIAMSDIVSGQADYAVPTNFNTLRSLMYNNFRLKGLSFASFNEYLDGFKSTTIYANNKPEVFMVYGGLITLFPTPNENLANGLRIYYSQHPANVTTLADSLGVPNGYHNAIVEYCLKKAYEMDENLWMVELKGQDFDQAIQKLKDKEKWTSREYYPTITTLPEDDGFLGGGGFYG